MRPGAQPLGLRVDAALAAGLLQRCPYLGAGEFGGLSRSGGGSQNDQGRGNTQPIASAEGFQGGGEVFVQVGAEFIAGLGAVPDGVLLGAGQDRNGLGQFGITWQLPMAEASVRNTLARTMASRWSDVRRATARRSR